MKDLPFSDNDKRSGRWWRVSYSTWMLRQEQRGLEADVPGKLRKDPAAAGSKTLPWGRTPVLVRDQKGWKDQ